MTAYHCASTKIDGLRNAPATRGAGIGTRSDVLASPHGDRRSRRRAFASPLGEGVRNFLTGVVIGLAIVGPAAVLDASDSPFLGVIVLWAVLAGAGGALHLLRGESSPWAGVDRDDDSAADVFETKPATIDKTTGTQ